MILVRRTSTSGLFNLFFLLLLLAGTSVNATTRSTKKVTTVAANTVLRGRASWYGREFQGLRTTNGERFNRFQYTCAHRTLPFGTRLRVTNPKTGKAVVVRVSDRGPYRHQRILDLAEVAARPLDIVRLGAITVVAEVVPATTPLGPTETPENLLALQASDPTPQAAFATYTVPAVEPAPLTPAEPGAVAPEAAAAVVTGQLAVPTTITFLVQAGTFATLANAQAMQAKIEALDQQLQVHLSAETIEGRVLTRVLVGSYAVRGEAEAVRRRLMVWGVGGLVREIAGL